MTYNDHSFQTNAVSAEIAPQVNRIRAIHTLGTDPLEDQVGRYLGKKIADEVYAATQTEGGGGQAKRLVHVQRGEPDVYTVQICSVVAENSSGISRHFTRATVSCSRGSRAELPVPVLAELIVPDLPIGFFDCHACSAATHPGIIAQNRSAASERLLGVASGVRRTPEALS